MKQKLLILLSAFMVAINAHAFFYTHEGQTLNYLKTSDTTCKVISYKANASNGTYIIPTTVANSGVVYTVTEIAENAFKGYTGLISLVIPESVTTIGDFAFENCSGLESLNLTEGVRYIGRYAFTGCSSLVSFIIPETVESIGDSAFSGCSSITSVEIPESVYYIGSTNAFSSCNSLESFYGKYSTDDHRCLVKDGELKSFAPSKLAYYSIPQTASSIGHSAFKDCSNLSYIIIPETVTSIGCYAFDGCSNLTSLDIPETVTKIDGFAFYGCSNLTSVVIPESVTSIDAGTFRDCSRLETVVIPESVYSIGSSAFEDCSNLTSIVIPESVTSIESNTFYGCNSLTSVVIPESVNSIGFSAFLSCSRLKSVEIPETLYSIGGSAFYNCSSLAYLQIPESVRSIGQQAFIICSSLDSIRVHNPDPSEIALGQSVFTGVDHRHCYLFVPKESKALYAEADQWKDFMKINYRVLNDGEAYQAEEDIEEPNVDYIREFKNTNWQPLYLPFAMNYDEWEPYADVAELYNVRGYDPDNDGEINEVTIEFNRLKEGASIQPNIPYVVKAKETGKVTFECKDKLVTAAPATEGMVECSSTKFTYAFHGIYEEKTDLFSTGAYFLSKGEFCQAANENVKLSHYRAYLTVTPKTGGYNGDTTPARAPQRILLVVDDEMETNGIDDIIDIAPHDDVYYDLMGRKVVHPTTGIYIQNGRKVYIK